MLTNRNLEAIAPVLATFKIKQTDDIDDLKDDNIGEPVKLTGNNEVGLIGDGDQLMGKLIALTLTDNHDGARLATVQIGGVCRLDISSIYPQIGNRVIGGYSATVKQAPSMLPAPVGGNIGRGTVIEVNGIVDCMVLLN